MLKWPLLGCDEMAKRISCRIVSSKPFGKSRSVLLHKKASNNTQHRTGDFVSGIPHGTYVSNPVTYTRLLNITRVPVDNALTGRILDFYA